LSLQKQLRRFCKPLCGARERERESEREKEGGWEEERGRVAGAGGGARAQQQEEEEEADGGRFGSSGTSYRTWSAWCKCFESEVEVKEGIEVAECKGRGRRMGCGGV
jgi:hypothetical protein